MIKIIIARYKSHWKKNLFLFKQTFIAIINQRVSISTFFFYFTTILTATAVTLVYHSGT